MTVRAPAGFAVIVTAAGRGSRAGGDAPKQWRSLSGRSVLARTLAAFSGFDRVVLVVHPDDMGDAIREFSGAVTIVSGGETRAASVRNGLLSLRGGGVSHVLIHDGARPLVSDDVIGGVIEALTAGALAAGALTLWMTFVPCAAGQRRAVARRSGQGHRNRLARRAVSRPDPARIFLRPHPDGPSGSSARRRR